MKLPRQCKDIPDLPILAFLAKRPGEWHNWYFGNDKDVRQAMPAGTPDKLILAKMRMLIRRDFVDGCGCGCRGDFEIKAKGLAHLQSTLVKLAADRQDDVAEEDAPLTVGLDCCPHQVPYGSDCDACEGHVPGMF